MTTENKMVFDAKLVGEVLGIQTPDSVAPTPSRTDERIVYLPPSIVTPKDLRSTKAPLWDPTVNGIFARYFGDERDNEYGYDQFQLTAKSGYWGVICPIEESAGLWPAEMLEQIPRILPGYQCAPLLVNVMLFCVDLLCTGKCLLPVDKWIVCPEKMHDGRNAFAFYYQREVRICSGYGGDTGKLSSAARWICD